MLPNPDGNMYKDSELDI